MLFKKLSNLILVILYSILLVPCLWADIQDKIEAGFFPEHHDHGQNTIDYIPNEILVKFNTSLSTEDFKKFSEQTKTSVSTYEKAIRTFHDFYDTNPLRSPLYGWQRLALPNNKNILLTMTEIKKNVLVEDAEPNYKTYAAALTTTFTATAKINDHYYADGQTQWWLATIKADEAFEKNYTFNNQNEIIIAVLDTGIDTKHPEFTDRLVLGKNILENNHNIEDNNNSLGNATTGGHGTQVAGIIIATINNQIGIAGCAWHPNIKLMPIKILNQQAQGNVAALAEGIHWAITKGANIINISAVLTKHSSLLATTCQVAKNKNKLILAAIGNDNRNLRHTPYYPAAYPEVMAIGATDAADNITFYSNYSDPPGLVACVAPGGVLQEYYHGFPSDHGILTTACGGKWRAAEGTSLATAQVSALAAMLWLQKTDNKVKDIHKLITDGCDFNPAWDKRFQGNGRINFVNSLSGIKIPQAPAASSTTENTTNQTSISPVATPTTITSSTLSDDKKNHSDTTATTDEPDKLNTDNLETTLPTTTPSNEKNSLPISDIKKNQKSSATKTFANILDETLSVEPYEIKAWPQPAKDKLNLAYQIDGSGKVSLEIHNQAGEVVLRTYQSIKTLKKVAITELKLTDFKAGIYYIKLIIYDKNGWRDIAKKIVIKK